MSGVLNAIIARGFDGPTPVQRYYQGQDQKRAVDNNQRTVDSSLQSADVNRRSAEINQQATQQEMAQNQQAQQQAQAQQAQLQQELGPLEAAYQANPQDPKTLAALQSFAVRAGFIDPKQGANIANIFGLGQQASQGSGFGNVNPGDYSPESLAQYAQTGDFADLRRQYAPAQPVVVNTPGFGVGIVDRNNPSSRVMLSTPENEAAARATVAASTAGAKVDATNNAQAVSDLPRVEANALDMLNVLNQLQSSKSLGWVYGAKSLIPTVPGTPQADAVALWEQVQGKAFLEAFGTLKGGGQITEKEGAKATAAITRLSNRSMSPNAAKLAIKEMRVIVNNGVVRARARAGRKPQAGGTSNEVNFDDLPE